MNLVNHVLSIWDKQSAAILNLLSGTQICPGYDKNEQFLRSISRNSGWISLGQLPHSVVRRAWRGVVSLPLGCRVKFHSFGSNRFTNSLSFSFKRERDISIRYIEVINDCHSYRSGTDLGSCWCTGINCWVSLFQIVSHELSSRENHFAM